MVATSESMLWFDVIYKGNSLLKELVRPLRRSIAPRVPLLTEFMSKFDIPGMSIVDLVAYLLICCGIFKQKLNNKRY